MLYMNTYHVSACKHAADWHPPETLQRQDPVTLQEFEAMVEDLISPISVPEVTRYEHATATAVCR